jgi:hypothetical protein
VAPHVDCQLEQNAVRNMLVDTCMHTRHTTETSLDPEFQALKPTRHTTETSSETSAPTAMRFSTAISAGDWILASGVACAKCVETCAPQARALMGGDMRTSCTASLVCNTCRGQGVKCRMHTSLLVSIMCYAHRYVGGICTSSLRMLPAFLGGRFSCGSGLPAALPASTAAAAAAASAPPADGAL